MCPPLNVPTKNNIHKPIFRSLPGPSEPSGAMREADGDRYSPRERQFWRIVNASPDLYADSKIDTERFEIVGLDGMPLAFHDPKRRTDSVDHVFLPPAARVEAIVTGPKVGAHASLRTLCIDTGPDGDLNPAMALADLVDLPHSDEKTVSPPRDVQTPVYKPVSSAQNRKH
jgi:suppressor of ftsI